MQGKAYGSFGIEEDAKSTRNQARRVVLSRAFRQTLLSVALIGLLAGSLIHILFHDEGATKTLPNNQLLAVMTANAHKTADTIPSCVGLKFKDPKHEGKEVCKRQQCVGVVYFRYVDVTTFACAPDAKLLSSPCDLSQCPGMPPPPAPTAAAPPIPAMSPAPSPNQDPHSPKGDPPIPESAAPGPGMPYPKPPSSFRIPITKIVSPILRAEGRKQPKQPRPITKLSGLHPSKDVGLSSMPRDKESFQAKRDLWGAGGPPQKQGWPTHVFWENLILGEGTDTDSAITNLPYVFQASQKGVSVAYPWTMSNAMQTANMFDLDNNGLRISAASLNKRSITDYDPVSVSLQWGDTKSGQTLETTMVQGDTYITFDALNLNGLELASNQALILSSRGDGSPNVKPEICDPTLHASKRPQSVKGTVFDIFASQTDHTWRFYTTESTTLTCPYQKNINHTSTKILIGGDSGSFTGTFRLALAANCTKGYGKHCFAESGLPLKSAQRTDPQFVKYLDAHRNVALVGGDVVYDLVNAGTTSQVDIWYQSRILGGKKDANGKSEEGILPLILAMPHHISSGNPGILELGVEPLLFQTHKSMLGFQSVVATDSLQMSLGVPSDIWGDATPLDREALVAIKSALTNDATYDISQQWQDGVGDPYNAGKLNARIARMALIANQLNETRIVSSFLDKLQNYVELWIAGKSANPLVYDEDMGGVVSCGCLFESCNGHCKPHCTNPGPSQKNGCPTLLAGAMAAGLDFGNGYYNDHHFHYGYHLYAAAVVAKFRKDWAKKHLEELLLLVRDVANPSSEDKYFPRFRHMDFYAGHSWAGGVFRSFANGRNQESTSEAVNCWYAIALLGDALGMRHIKSLGLSLLATEVHGAQTYWQLIEGQTDYDRIYAGNGVTGILWSNLAQFQTWFGLFSWAVNGIQMLPFTPVSNYLLRKEWISQQIKPFDKACGQSDTCTNDGWSPLVCMARSIVNRAEGKRCAENLPKHAFSDLTAEGNGNSMTNTMHFIMAR